MFYFKCLLVQYFKDVKCLRLKIINIEKVFEIMIIYPFIKSIRVREKKCIRYSIYFTIAKNAFIAKLLIMTGNIHFESKVNTT